jgi:hypothetical protein
MAMVWELIRRGEPLNEVVRYNNGMDFECIDRLWEKVKAKCEPLGIKCTELKPKNDFLYDMLERPKTKRNGEKVWGDGWCGGACRWGTFEKIATLNKYALDKNAIVYIGLALDETKRIAELEWYKRSPLADWGYTQEDCLKINRQNGIEWLEKTPRTESGYIDLYSILDRVSCWCCANKNLWELYNMWYYLPNYWERLKQMQSRIEMPMKNFKNNKFGEYGNVFDLEKVFKSGFVPKHKAKAVR